jgi:hypothetical protein
MLCLVISKLIHTKFTLITVDTVYMITNVFIENHYVFRLYRSSSGGTVIREFITELLYYPILATF